MEIESEPLPCPYKALSYSWGWPERTAPVKCNGAELLVPPSLSDALRHMRSIKDPYWYWCDAIRIDQENLAEKAHQVQQMLTIFAKAEEVIAWLGLPDSDCINKAQIIEYVSRRSFWHRVWIVQEMYAARNCSFRCGIHVLEAHRFATNNGSSKLLHYLSMELS